MNAGPHIAAVDAAAKMPQFNICQVATNQFYRLYDDLIGVVAGALAELGYPCSVSKNNYRAGAINILIGSTIFASRHLNLPGTLQGRPYVVYQLEQLDEQHGLLAEWPEYWTLLQNATAIWDYAPSSARYLTDKGLGNVHYLPPGYHRHIEQFAPAPVPDRDIDVLFYGSPHPRRHHVLQQLARRGLKVVHLPAKFGDERNQFIRRARIVLNVHAWDDLNVLETVRISYLLANRCLVVSESSDHNPYGDGVVFAPYEQLVETCLQQLARPAAELAQVVDAGYQAIRALPCAASLRPVLASMARAG